MGVKEIENRLGLIDVIAAQYVVVGSGTTPGPPVPGL